MGEYYNWVNVDRKEYISPYDFEYGNKRYESCQRDGDVIMALRDLLANEWKGCMVFWMGDEIGLPDDTSNPLFIKIKNHCDEIGEPLLYDMILESYRNVSGLFKRAEKTVREEIGLYLKDIVSDRPSMLNEYGIDSQKPYEGLFLRDAPEHKYIINYTRKVCFSYQETKIILHDGSECDYEDPLPNLLGYGRSMDCGAWVGDVIGAEDELPDGISILESIMLEW